MKIEVIDDGLKIFCQNYFFKDISWDEKDEVIDKIKEIFLKIRRNYHVHIKGLYRVKVYPSKYGVIIEAVQIEEETYTSADVDLRIIILFQKDIYLKIEDSSFIENKKVSYFYKDNYYLDIDEKDINKYIEFGSLVLDDEI